VLIRNAIIREQFEIIHLYGGILNNTAIKCILKISVNKKYDGYERKAECEN
jgi:hypothetical protein